MTQAVTTTLSTSHVVMEAGQERESEILVRNQGDEMDQFTVQVLGPAAAWTTVVPSVVTVPAGEEEWVRVVYAPPRSAEARQGKSHVAFRVTSYNDPSTSTLEEAVVEVAGFAELEVRLDPPQRTTTRRGRFVLTAVNRGNSAVRCQASAYGLDEGEGLDILVAGPEFVSEPGSTTQLPVRVQARRRFMRGQDLSLPFAVEVNGDILERPAMVEGILNQAPVLNAARLKLLLAALALLALLLGGWFTWYSLTSGEEPLEGGSNGQTSGAPGGQQAPVIGEAGSAGLAGTSGSAGLPGLPGASGNQGLAGEAGAAGGVGAAGAAGDAGAVGAAGAAGTAGAAGNDGQAGAQGAAGLVGQPGSNGTNGTNGTSIELAPNGALPLPASLTAADAGRGFVTPDGMLHVWNGSSYNAPVQFQGPTGGTGPQGDRGAPGRNGTTVEGVVATYEDLEKLQLDGLTDVGKGYVVTADRKLYVWNGAGWNAGIPFQGADGKDAVLPPESVVLALPTVQPQAQPIEMTHFIPSGSSALYYIRSDFGPAEINQISVVDRPGGKGTLTLTSQGPGGGDIVTAAATTDRGITAGGPFDSAITVTPQSPLLATFVCTPDPGYQACTATVTVSFRSPVPTTMGLSAPADPTAGVVSTFPAVHHQLPGGRAFTRYTVTSDGGDAEIVGATLTGQFGGTSALALGPDTLGDTRPTVTATTAQTFGAPGTQPVIVSPGNPLFIDVSCPTFTGTFNTCGGTVSLTARKPTPIDLRLAAPEPDGATTQTFDLSRTALTNSPTRFLLQTPVDRQITGIAAVDTDAAQSSRSVVALGPTPTTGARTTITSAADFRSSPWAGQVLVTPVTPYSLDLSCSAENATTGCAVRVAVTFGPPPPTDLTITGGAGDQGAPTEQKSTVAYDPGQNASGRYLIKPTIDSVVTSVRFTGSDPNSTLTVQPAGSRAPGSFVQPAAVGVNRVVTTAVPLLVEFKCSPMRAAQGCTADLITTTALPATSAVDPASPMNLTYNPVNGRDTGRYLVTPGAGDRVLSSLSLDDGGAAQGATLLVTPPQGAPFSVTPGTAWNAATPFLVTNKVPLLVELKCGPAFAAAGCSAVLTATTGDPAAGSMKLADPKGAAPPTWPAVALKYDAKNNANGVYGLYTEGQDMEYVSMSVSGANVESVALPGNQVVRPGAPWNGSIFANAANPAQVAVKCTDAGQPCAPTLNVTGAYPTVLTLPTSGTEDYPLTAGVAAGTTARFVLRPAAGASTITSFGITRATPQQAGPIGAPDNWTETKVGKAMGVERSGVTIYNSISNPTGNPTLAVTPDSPGLAEVRCLSSTPCLPILRIGVS